MGESGAQRAVTPPTSVTGGSTPSASTTASLAVLCSLFDFYMLRALPIVGGVPSIFVLQPKPLFGRLYELKPEALEQPLADEVVQFIATRIRGVRA